MVTRRIGSSPSFAAGLALVGTLPAAIVLAGFGALPLQAQITQPPPSNPGNTPSGSTGTSTPTNAGNVRFQCQVINGQYTVTYLPESQPGQAYPWAVPSQLGSAWSPERRCNEISRRLESYRPDGLVEMQTAVENGYNTVCVTTERVPTCRIVFTVPPGQDPVQTRDRVFQNLTIADSGQQTQGVNTFTGSTPSGPLEDLINIGSSQGRPNSGVGQRRGGLYLKPYLDPRDGGTGAMLTGGAARDGGRQLNPDRFR